MTWSAREIRGKSARQRAAANVNLIIVTPKRTDTRRRVRFSPHPCGDSGKKKLSTRGRRCNAN
jgi:hypothetical protein